MDTDLLAGVSWQTENKASELNHRHGLNAETELYFQGLNRDRMVVLLANRHISDTINQSLPCQDLNTLLSLIPYIETGIGQTAYRYVGEVHRILRILHIVEIEQQHQKELFLTGCMDQSSLMEKYMLSLFAFRRLLFQLSQTSINEAVHFLDRSRLSVIAVYVISQEELMIPDKKFYYKVLEIYSEFWSEDEKQLLLSLIAGN